MSESLSFITAYSLVSLFASRLQTSLLTTVRGIHSVFRLSHSAHAVSAPALVTLNCPTPLHRTCLSISCTIKESSLGLVLSRNIFHRAITDVVALVCPFPFLNPHVFQLPHCCSRCLCRCCNSVCTHPGLTATLALLTALAMAQTVISPPYF